MTDLVLDRSPTTDALLAALQTAFDPIPVGLSAVPRVGANKTPALPPYVILYPLWTTLTDEGWGVDRHADAAWTYQAALQAARGDQLEIMRDKAIRAFLGKHPSGDYLHDLDTEETTVIGRSLTDDDGQGDATGDTLLSDLRFGLLVTRADT